MAVVSTPMGFKKPDGNEPVRNVDDIIAGNADLSEQILTEVRGRLAVLDPSGESLQMTDEAMSAVINSVVSQFSQILRTRMDEQITSRESAINPADKGVTIDGTTDATAAFQAMLDELPSGAVVRTRRGQKFKITAPLQLTKPVTIEGRGEFIPGSNRVIEIRSSDVTLDEFTITGPGAALGYTDAGRFIIGYGTSTTLLDNVQIRRLKLNECRDTAIRLEWCSNFRISDCLIDRFQYGGIMILSGKGGRIWGNKTRTALQVGLTQSYGIAITDATNDIPGRSENILVFDNEVEGIPWEGIDTHSGENIQFIGNRTKSCLVGIAMVTGNGTRLHPPTRCVAVGNVIVRGTAADTAWGIGLAGAGTSSEQKARATITGNTISGYTTDISTGNGTAHEYQETYIAGNTTSAGYANKRDSNQPFYRTYMITGTVVVSNGHGTANVVFPTGMFTQPPAVFLQRMNQSKYTCYSNQITTTGCVVGMTDPTNTTGGFTLSYTLLAVQANSTTPMGRTGS